jgi:hypothetical protein
MQKQSISKHSSIGSLHLGSSLARPHKLTTLRPLKLRPFIQNTFIDFSVASTGHTTRILRCAAAADIGGPTAETSSQGIYANIDFRFDVKDVCELKVSGKLGKLRSMITPSIKVT